MKCQWTDLLNLLPGWLRQAVDEGGREDAQEIRLRINMQPEIVKGNGSVWLDGLISEDDIRFCLNAATRYSPWTSDTIVHGYITAPGGHRMGLCGQCIYDQDKLKNVNYVTSVCIRVARDFPGVSGDIYKNHGSILIIGAPGSGKTTFIRDLIRNISDLGNSAVAVVDERRELFPIQAGKYAFSCGKRTDILSGCSKNKGIDMVLRTMGPDVIAMDEITEEADCQALTGAAWCGVRLIATAHAGSKQDLLSRRIYRPIVDSKIFHTLITLQSDKAWKEEAMPV